MAFPNLYLQRSCVCQPFWAQMKKSPLEGALCCFLCSRKHGEGFFRWVHLNCSHESHYKVSLQGIIIMKVNARSHCKESLQGVIARSHCKESWQGLQLDSLHLQLDSMHLQLALESMHLAPCTWLLALGSLHLQLALNSVHLRLALDSMHLAPCNLQWLS